MAYTSNVPLSTQTIAYTQSLILGNFQALAPFGNGYALFTQQSAAPTVSGNDIAIYSLNNSGTSDLYLKRSSGTPYTFTDYVNTAASGWSYLPSGILLQWGQINAGTTGAKTITFSSSPSFTVAPYSLQISSLNQSVSAYVTALATGSATVQVTSTGGGTAKLMWFAIGV